MGSQAVFPPAIGLIWAGTSLGGSLIAAPASFRAPSLDMPTAFEIAWLGYTEWALLLLLIGVLFLSRIDLDWRFNLLPILLFLIQQLGLMPRVDDMTLERMNASSANSHITFIAGEVLKFLALVSILIFTLITLTE